MHALTVKGAAVTVATDKSGQFTEIGDAISYAQHNEVPTVTVLAGTYPAVTVSATPSVAVIGQSKSDDDNKDNKVVVSTEGTALELSVNVDGITFQNINFITTGEDDPSVNIKGSELAFYACQFVSAGPVGIETGLGVGIIANSYIEAQETIIDGKATLYIFNTDIVPVADSALLVYTTGTDSDGTLYNSTVVFDQATVSPKPDDKSERVYLAKAKGLGSVAVYRGSTLDGFIAGSGVYVDDITQDDSNFYAEYGDTGAGAYPSNKDARSPYVTLLDDSAVSQFSIGTVFASAYPGLATSDTNWIDHAVLAAIKNADESSSSDGSSPSATSGAGTDPSSTSATSPESSSSPFVVSTTPSKGQYKSVQGAIDALPDDGSPYVIEIKSGTYKEQISIKRDGKVTLRGDTTFKNDFTKNTVTIEYEDGVATTTNSDDQTPVINVKVSGKTVVALYNINFQNTYPQSADTVALAADFDGLVAAYGCSFIGYHHTLFANQGTQVFSNSHIEGSIDFIWGSSTAYFHQSYIATNTAGHSIAAQGRSSETASGGFVFDTSVITYTTSYGTSFGKTFLGRPVAEYSVVIYMNSFLDKQISPVGWSSVGEDTENVIFGEYKNSGPGSSLDDRASFAKVLTESEAQPYTLKNWIGDTSWLDMTAYDYVPSYDLSSGTGGASPANPNSTGTDDDSTDSPDPTTGTSPASPSGLGTAGHPESGTKPPTGAILVSVSAKIDKSYSSLTEALKSLPSDGSLQVIFIYEGTYHEQVPTIDRDGPIKIIGYTEGSPGQSYADNEVTIIFSSGKSAPSDTSISSGADTATVSTTSANIAFYNINIINSENLDGAETGYIAVAASVSGSHNAFYACSFIDWQDTLLTSGAAAFQYYESSYVEGAVDLISGSSTAYFKGCTLGAKLKGGAFTAQSRPSTTAGGYIFDQCLFGAATNATGDLTNSVYLGRPRSEYALVVVKFSQLTGAINPSGWTVWSSTDPRTDEIMFAEYKNTGPGNWENNEAAREAFGHAKLLSSDTYTLSDVMDSTDWIDLTYSNSITTPKDEPGSGSSPDTPKATSDSTTPPDGAFIVSKTSIANKQTYDTIQSALDALPTSATASSTVFIYPGTYDEHIEINNPGTVILIGYSDSPKDNEKNKVTIQNSKGGDASSDNSLSSSATVYANGKSLQAININFSNTYDGASDSSVAFAVASSKYASLYSCRVTGKMNALVVNGFFFAANSYVEGSADMISGGGAGYFLVSTISPSEDDISITADKRASDSTPGGLVFDQCKVTPVGGAGLMSEISLGRPQNSHARVAYIETHLGSCVEPKGWEIWSYASPRTDGVLFGEYKNDGPGSDTSRRVSFATQLIDQSVVQFEIANFFDSLSWIDFSRVSGKPFSVTPSKDSDGSSDPTGASSTVSSGSAGVSPTSSPGSADAASTSSPGSANAASTSSGSSTSDPAESTGSGGSSVSDGITTSTVLVTVTSSTTTTKAKTTSTKTETNADDSDSTTTPATVIQTYTSAESTKTVQKTSTVTQMVTDPSLKATYTRTVTTTTVITSTPPPSITTSTLTITSAAGTITKTGKTTVSTSSVTSTSTKTESTTTTLSCIPAKKVKRSLLPPRFIPATTTAFPNTTNSAMTAKSVSHSPKLSTDTMTTDIHHAEDTISFVTSTVIKTGTATVAAEIAVVTVTKDAGDSGTIDSITSTETVTAAVKTETSVDTTTVSSTVGQAPAASTVILVVQTETSTSILSLPVATSTKTETTTYSDLSTVTITSRPTSTKTKTVNTTSTTTSTVTTTLTDATTCA
ncbi:Pectinesterase catalytic [Penicillium odoratum]|uniref:Pectinesterase catalytic n=1 Tax=Penicillium odoratum TaxID=1167516 RepID=UPI0025492338|nr:Pectinesterase catalytic [Penicillium odoratum]KAJ5768736.1 Pectinesterase catalytic [Penicillium odoratum]